MRLPTLALLCLVACGDKGQRPDSAEPTEPDLAAGDATWEALSEEDLAGDGKDDDDEGSDGKGDDSGQDDTACGEEVVAGAPCEGDWSETMCVDAGGVWWWCEDGEWTSDK